jgi:hypothetical protein
MVLQTPILPDILVSLEIADRMASGEADVAPRPAG